MITFKEYLLLEEISKSLMEKISEKIDIPKKDEEYQINENDAKEIYSILNKELFNSKLRPCKIIVETFDPTKHKNRDGEHFYGRHFCEFDGLDIHRFVFSNNFDASKIKTSFAILLLNGRGLTFEEFLNVFVHEMIHAYDFQYGPGKEDFISDAIISNYHLNMEHYNEHGPWFKDMMERLNNKFDLNIQVRLKRMKEEKTVNEKIEQILEGIQESDALIFNGCEDKDLIKIAKRFRLMLKDDGTNAVEITKEGNIRIIGYD